MKPRTRSRWAALTSGPIWVSSCKGSPTRKARTVSVIASTMWRWWARGTGWEIDSGAQNRALAALGRSFLRPVNVAAVGIDRDSNALGEGSPGGVGDFSPRVESTADDGAGIHPADSGPRCRAIRVRLLSLAPVPLPPHRRSVTAEVPTELRRPALTLSRPAGFRARNGNGFRLTS